MGGIYVCTYCEKRWGHKDDESKCPGSAKSRKAEDTKKAKLLFNKALTPSEIEKSCASTWHLFVDGKPLTVDRISFCDNVKVKEGLHGTGWKLVLHKLDDATELAE